MFCHKYMGVLAMLAAMVASNVDAQLASGICYSPWHHTEVNSDVLAKDMEQVKQYFSSVRTFHASFSGNNAIEMAAKAGIKIAVGIQMNDPAGIAGEIQAACDGANAHPDAVEAIYVGNENFKNADFGTYTASELVDYINQIKSCTAGKNIPVGTVQRINEWISASDASTLAGACDVIGVNIYPFFTQGDQTPIEKLKIQYAQMTEKYTGGNVHVTETGWPTAGETSFGNVPSVETMQQFVNDYAEWAGEHPQSYYFMMYDTTVSYSGMEYEKHFGVADKDGNVLITMPSSSGSTTPATEAPATEAPATDAPTEAPATDAPAATVGTPDYGDNENQDTVGGDADAETPTVTPAATTPAPEATPAATTPAPEATTAAPAPEATTGAPAPEATTASPAVTPAATSPTATSNNHADCDA